MICHPKPKSGDEKIGMLKKAKHPKKLIKKKRVEFVICIRALSNITRIFSSV
jgi:hypothetical protein